MAAPQWQMLLETLFCAKVHKLHGFGSNAHLKAPGGDAQGANVHHLRSFNKPLNKDGDLKEDWMMTYRSRVQPFVKADERSDMESRTWELCLA
mmetsp:Transcript_97970/g.174433  ORF Transcript_97970/g.174433 Transcript_97970/m.174433 type:complete len:93 (-) Transcript_97970:73-351(-)